MTLPTDEAISELAEEMLLDPIWLNTLDNEYHYLEDAKSALRDAMLGDNAFRIVGAELVMIELYRKAAYRHAKTVLQRQEDL